MFRIVRNYEISQDIPLLGVNPLYNSFEMRHHLICTHVLQAECAGKQLPPTPEVIYI